MADVQVHADADAAAAGLGAYTAAVAAEAIEARGAFSVAIAGGSLVKVRGGLRGEMCPRSTSMPSQKRVQTLKSAADSTSIELVASCD